MSAETKRKLRERLIGAGTGVTGRDAGAEAEVAR